MKKGKQVVGVILAVSLLVVSGCGNGSSQGAGNAPSSAANTEQTSGQIVAQSGQSQTQDSQTQSQEPQAAEALTVQFGDGTLYTMHLYDNDTAAAIAKHVGTASWNLPIYHYDDFENWEVMQYYDIPSRYEIPSNAEHITEEAGGTVYYSEPNRIVLFYHDAQVEGDYTPIGYFDYSEEFAKEVEDNPVLQGWGNKLVHIMPQN